MPDDKFAFSYAASDLDGVAVQGRVRLNPLHSAVAHLLMKDAQRHPLIEVICKNETDATRRLRIKVNASRYSDEIIDTLILTPGEEETLRLFPAFVPEKVAELNALTPTYIRIHLDDLATGQILFETMLPLDLLAVNSAPLAALDPTTEQFLDQTRYFGAFVTPDDPEIDAFMQAAARFLPDGETFAGYRGSVYAQVEAFYNALAARGVRYVDSVLDFNPSPQTQVSQRVRLPRQALTMQAANCIDGTLLLASLLEHVGIEPAIVILPRHALVAWAPTAGSDKWRYLETTAIGVHPFAKAVETGGNFAAGAAQAQQQASAAGYFRLWPLRDLRAAGIFPLPVTGDDSLRRIAQALERANGQEDVPGPPDDPTPPEVVTVVPTDEDEPPTGPPLDVNALPWTELGPLLDELVDLFTEAELRQLVDRTFDQRLDVIAGGANLQERVYNLMNWAKRRSALATLVAAAHTERPNSEVLARYTGTGPAPTAPQPAPIAPPPSAGSPSASSPTAGDGLTLVQRVRRDALQKRLDLLLEQHAKASDQLNATLDAVNRPIIQAQIRSIEEEMMQVEDQLTQLLST